MNKFIGKSEAKLMVIKQTTIFLIIVPVKEATMIMHIFLKVLYDMTGQNLKSENFVHIDGWSMITYISYVL